jgi:hypothetical protein
MADYGAMIRSAFELGSIADAQSLFVTCVKNAFPTNDFRRLELLRFLREDQYLEGRSLNHVFEMQAGQYNGHKVWDVRCRRVTSGSAPQKHVYVDYSTLDFLCYVL